MLLDFACHSTLQLDFRSPSLHPLPEERAGNIVVGTITQSAPPIAPVFTELMKSSYTAATSGVVPDKIKNAIDARSARFVGYK